MTDHAHDPERLVGRPVTARHVQPCPGCPGKILPGDEIVQVAGAWVHADGSCADVLEDRMRETA